MFQQNSAIPAHLQFQALVDETLTAPVLGLIFDRQAADKFDPLLKTLEDTTRIVKSTNEFPELLPLRLSRVLIYVAQDAKTKGVDLAKTLCNLHLSKASGYRTISRLLMRAILLNGAEPAGSKRKCESMRTLSHLVGAACSRIQRENNYTE